MSERRCPACGSQVEKGWKVCRACGGSLTAAVNGLAELQQAAPGRKARRWFVAPSGSTFKMAAKFGLAFGVLAGAIIGVVFIVVAASHQKSGSGDPTLGFLLFAIAFVVIAGLLRLAGGISSFFPSFGLAFSYSVGAASLVCAAISAFKRDGSLVTAWLAWVVLLVACYFILRGASSHMVRPREPRTSGQNAGPHSGTPVQKGSTTSAEVGVPGVVLLAAPVPPNVGWSETGFSSDAQVIGVESLRAELERLRFGIVSQAESELVAIQKRPHWRPFSTNNMPYVVFMRAVSHLTSTQVESDRRPLATEARKLRSFRLLGRLRTVVVIPVYLADRVLPDAQAYCASEQSGRYGSTIYFPVAYDKTTGEAFYLQDTPTSGWAHYARLRFVAQRLVEPDRAPEKWPGLDRWAAFWAFLDALDRRQNWS